jgi:serine/threonine protein kinase
LIRLVDTGFYQQGNNQFIFVVMEYADETLAEALLQRPLTPGEVREMLPTVAGALAFLHERNLVQGQLGPASVLVVGDQIKLASDSVRPIGEPAASIATASSYDPPESNDGRLSPAGDVWALGMTIVEALTQYRAAANDAQSAIAQLPTTLDPALGRIVRRCLSYNPTDRPTAVELEAEFKPAPAARETSVPEVVAHEVPPRVLASDEAPRRRVLVWILAAGVALAAVLWAGRHWSENHSTNPTTAAPAPSSGPPPNYPPEVAQKPPATAPAQAEPIASGTKSGSSRPAPVRASRPVQQATQSLAGETSAVDHEEIPIASHSALATIHGHVRVTVRVTVDPAGNVIDTFLQDPGPSAYFARLATGAAREWKFTPTDTQARREWLLRFKFGRDETTGHAEPKRP